MTMKKERRSSFTLVIELLALILIFAVIIGAMGADTLKKTFDKSEYPREYLKEVGDAAAEFEVDPLLIFAIIKAESGFDKNAVSSAGAVGLMQIMPSTYETDIKDKLGIDKSAEEALLEPALNIRAGAYYFTRWLIYFDDVGTALAAYNAGFGNVREWLKSTRYSADGETLIAENIPFEQTRTYVLRVMYYYEEYTRLYGEEEPLPPPAQTTTGLDKDAPITWVTKGPDEQGRYFVNPLACYEWAVKYTGIYKSVDPILVMAIIKTESDFVVNAVSEAGAYGLMQIMPATYNTDIKPSIGLPEDFEYLLEDPEFAVKCGTYYLHWLYADSRRLGGSMVNVIAAYHGGCNAVAAWLADDSLAADGELIISEIPVGKTRRYVEKVLENYEYFKGIFG